MTPFLWLEVKERRSQRERFYTSHGIKLDQVTQSNSFISREKSRKEQNVGDEKMGRREEKKASERQRQRQRKLFSHWEAAGTPLLKNPLKK